VYDFLFVMIKLFLLSLTVETLQAIETLQAEICRCQQILKGVGHFDRPTPIKGETGNRPPTTVGWQKTRRIALSCGIKISLIGSFRV